MLQILAASDPNDPMPKFIGAACALIVMVVMAVMHRRAQKKQRYTGVGWFDNAGVLAPMCGGMITVRVPSGLVPIARPDGELVLAPQQACGVTLHLSGFMLADDGEGEDVVQRWVDNWAAANDAEVTTRTKRVVARAQKQVDAQGKEFDVRCWLVGIEPMVLSIVAEIDTRNTRSGQLKSLMAKVPAIIDSIEVNVERHSLANEAASRSEYVTYQAGGLVVNHINKHDQAFLEKWQARAHGILRTYLAAGRLERLTPATLDCGLALWQRDTDSDKPSFEDVVRAFGVAMGNHCVRALELRWAITEVDGVRNYVLRHAPTNVLAFPLRTLEGPGPFNDRFTPLFGVINAAIQAASNRAHAA